MSSSANLYGFKQGADIFSPKENLELARASTVLVNEAEDLALVPMSKFNFGDRRRNWIHMVTLANPPRSIEIPLASSGDAFWLDSRTVGQVVAKPGAEAQELVARSVRIEAGSLTVNDGILIGDLPAGAENFVYTSSGEKLVFSAGVYDDYDLSKVKQHDDDWSKRGNSALVYESTFMRYIDTWRTPKRSSLFSVTLKQTAGCWQLGSNYHSVLKGTGHHVPSEPFGGTEEYTVSSTSIGYTVKDPELAEAWHTKQNIYIVDIEGHSRPRELTTGNHGAALAPSFNRKGDKIAWLEQATDGDEAASTYVVIYDLVNNTRSTVCSDWDRSPTSFAFSPADDLLYLVVPNNARGQIFVVPLLQTSETPKALTTFGTASALRPLADGRLLFMRSSFTSPNDVFILETPNTSGEERRLTDLYSNALAGKYLCTPTEMFWTGGAVKDRKLQGWVFFPPGFKAGDAKKWPAIMMTHGGPQALRQDIWFPRYCLNVYANQGYVLFAPNWTGSTSFGQDFTDAISGDWGGAPFEDMRAGWTEFLKRYPEVDAERTAGWGASWGGYAINWIAGHPEYDFGFKTLVNKCGIFDLTSYGWCTTDTFTYNRAVGGMAWDHAAHLVSEKNSPANYVDKWTTPILLIHGSKDYSIPDTEAIAAFHALQQRGIRSRLVIFPDDNHYIMKPGNSLKYNQEIFSWLDDFIGKKSDLTDS